MESWAFPELYCPFPSTMNPHTSGVEHRAVTWATQQGLLTDPRVRTRLEHARVGRLITRTHPDGEGEPLQLLTDWYTWLFLQDDECDETAIGRDPIALAVLYNRFVAVLKGAPLHSNDHPLTIALSDIRLRLEQRVSSKWMQHFLQSIAATFDACLWEAHNRATHRIPPIEEYLLKRPYTGGLYTLVDMVEVTDHLNLPIAVYDHPYLQALTRRATSAICLANDVLSLGKELEQGDIHNLVLILHHHTNLSLQEAIDRVAMLHDLEVKEFIALDYEMPSFGSQFDPGVKRYSTLLKAWMRGNLDWSALTGRYHIPQPVVKE